MAPTITTQNGHSNQGAQSEQEFIVLTLRDFLMRLALYQSGEFSRNDVRSEARLMLRAVDKYLFDEMTSRKGEMKVKPVKGSGAILPVDVRSNGNGKYYDRQPVTG